MAQALLERPDATDTVPLRLPVAEPPGPSPRTRRAVRLGAAALGLALLVPLADRALDLLPGLDNPLASQAVDRTGPALMLALDDLAEYHAATGTFQSVVDLERDTPYVPSAVSGERTTYLATGTVDAVVDFTGLGAGAVRTGDDGTSVTISLPAARLDRPVIDHEQSRVVARDRGLFDRIGGVFSDSPTSEAEVTALAADRLEAAAAESDLRRRAEENTRRTLEGLARSFGFTDVTVTFDAADRL